MQRQHRQRALFLAATAAFSTLSWKLAVQSCKATPINMRSHATSKRQREGCQPEQVLRAISKWKKDHKNFVSEVLNVDSDEPVVGHVHEEQAQFYIQSACHASVVCETGYSKGVSANMWLSIGKELHSFDIAFSAAPLSLPYLRERHPGKIHTYEGTTRATLSEFKPQSKCQLVHIDGSHAKDDAYLDFVDIAPHTEQGALVFFDDTFDCHGPLDNDPESSAFCNYCSKSYWRAVDERKITHIACVNYGRKNNHGSYPLGFCYGKKT